MMKDRKTEEISSYIHVMWTKWYLHMKNNFENENFSKKEIWNDQAEANYEDLSEEDKEKDRKFAREIVEILEKVERK